MRVVTQAELEVDNANYINIPTYFSVIDLYKYEQRKLVKKIGELKKDKEAEIVLNMLGQNIQELDTLQYSYKHLGETLSFDMLGRGEKVILISYAAKLTGTTIYLKNDIKELTKTTKRLYYNEFKDSDNINIIVENDLGKQVLIKEFKGEIK